MKVEFTGPDRALSAGECHLELFSDDSDVLAEASRAVGLLGSYNCSSVLSGVEGRHAGVAQADGPGNESVVEFVLHARDVLVVELPAPRAVD